MSYIPSVFKTGDLVETTEEYREWAEKYYVNIHQRTQTYTKGLVKNVHTLHHKDTGEPMIDYIVLDNGHGAKAEHYQTPFFNCPVCKTKCGMFKFNNNNIYFSCDNKDCRNIHIYDVFTLYELPIKFKKVV